MRSTTRAIALSFCLVTFARTAIAQQPVAPRVIHDEVPAPKPKTRDPDDAMRAADARRRAKLAIYHRSMGITTWISLAAATTIGTLRYANVIGFGEPLCAPGNTPIFGRSFGCGTGHRVWHLGSVTFTTISYVVTRTLAGMMPDPHDAGGRGTQRAARLRWHRALSWVHLAGMAAMPVLGAATAGTRDPAARNALGTAHLAVGYATLASLSAAASIMAF